MSHLDNHSILTDKQHGFRSQHSCNTQLIQTVHDFAQSLDHRKQTDVIIMDFSKAFDVVPHTRLLNKLHHFGIAGNTHRWISNFLTNRQQRVVIGGDHSEWAPVRSGVPQGTVLGPLLFLLFINDLPDNISSHVRLFADDCVIYREIVNDFDSQALQHDLDILSKWESNWQMRFNADKCFVLKITHARKHIFQHNYKLGNSILQETQSHTYLGVDINKDLKWNNHINRISAKGNRTLGFIKRNLNSCTEDIKSMAYKTLVRPTIEYCSAVWDPHTQEQIHQLESIQKRAARFVKKDYSRQSSITQILKDLDWPSLQTRRKIDRLTILQKAREGHLALPLRNVLHPAQRLTKRSHINAYQELQTNKDTFKFSFFPRTVKDWNSLPKPLTDITDTKAFKAELQRHFHQD